GQKIIYTARLSYKNAASSGEAKALLQPWAGCSGKDEYENSRYWSGGDDRKRDRRRVQGTARRRYRGKIARRLPRRHRRSPEHSQPFFPNRHGRCGRQRRGQRALRSVARDDSRAASGRNRQQAHGPGPSRLGGFQAIEPGRFRNARRGHAKQGSHSLRCERLARKRGARIVRPLGRARVPRRNPDQRRQPNGLARVDGGVWSLLSRERGCPGQARRLAFAKSVEGAQTGQVYYVE